VPKYIPFRNFLGFPFITAKQLMGRHIRNSRGGVEADTTVLVEG
jgi:hypothetical protein